MTLPLRERRRQQTARDIQIVTLEMAQQHGLENITTDEIASAAGISTRTFFNYYSNKEAAAIGAPPPFQEENVEALREGTGSLATDLKLFLDNHMEVMADDETIMKLVGNVIRTNEKARGILEGFLIMERRELTECLNHRVKNRQTAVALAHFCTGTIGQTIFLWEHDQNLSLGAALDKVWTGQMEAAKLLVI
ncbi:TetR/AcrR family transcriptional regulator [Neptunicoccus cionae]|uniref:TetR/AcrR family transcriptional regulator n=1 Tax=Neptunicoccus cionae TaxID=2035344 RepID=UPI000C762370|nr:TetR/AcrR family transcriptional regulator [Amylibacter cionae]PLS21718.1 hypothetical protein C0U40_09500 [Amylibacter cionae]